MARIWKGLAALVFCGVVSIAAQAVGVPNPWEQPAAALAEQIAAILGPGQAQLTIRNLSSIANSDVAPIRRLMEQDLKARGITISGAESANSIRVTLSESARQRVWVAEVAEGDQVQVAMVDLPRLPLESAKNTAQIQLRKERFASQHELDSLPCFPEDKPPLLAVAETQGGLAVLKQGCLVALDRSPAGFVAGKGFYHLDSMQPKERDPRGMLTVSSDGAVFTAFFPGTECAGTFTASTNPNRAAGDGWDLHCHSSDDPWPIITNASGTPLLKAFFNPSRNYFTGVVAPSVGVDLPPFYSAVAVPRAGSNIGLLIAEINGKVQLAENGALHTVVGTQDWGSDFAVLGSGCGPGAQVIVSTSGEAVNDSLRAYDLPALEAVPASASLAMEGTVMAMWAAPDARSVLAVVRRGAEYEVDRVTALCN